MAVKLTMPYLGATNIKRIKKLSPAQQHLFVALVKERLPLAEQFEDMQPAQIVVDCLSYAEETKDCEKELAWLRQPIPSSHHDHSHTGWAMRKYGEGWR